MQYKFKVKKETLREYIERIIRQVVEVKGANTGLKYSIFENGLRTDITFMEKLEHKVPKNMSDLFALVQPYMNVTKKHCWLMKPRGTTKGGDNKHRDGDKNGKKKAK